MNSALLKALEPRLSVSLEDITGGETVKEREYEIYGTVADLEAMKAKASHSEDQVQWGMPCNEGAEAGITGSIRVRQTTKSDGEPVYTQTIKEKGIEDTDENEIEIGQSTYEIFSRLVPNGLMKVRYFFPLEGMDFELQVDVFRQPDGTECNTVKIDIEVPEGVSIDKVVIPFKIEDVRVITPGKKSKEDSDYVRELFSNHYEFKNPLHQKSE